MIIGLKSIVDIDGSYDTWAYHLPFAARLWGIIPENGFIFDAYQENRFLGFGIFGEFLQGFFWKIFRSPEWANLVCYLSLIIYLVFLKRFLSIPLYLSTLGLLAIPLVQAHATTAYIDLPSNLALAAAILLTYQLYIVDITPPKNHLYLLLITAAIAANTRLQLAPIIFIVIIFALPRIAYLSKWQWQKSPRRSLAQLATLSLALLVIFAPLVRNTFVYHNPVYPVGIKLAGVMLNHTEIPPTEPELPGHNVSRPVRWLYSLFELFPRTLYDGRWSIDQGSPDPNTSMEFGGFFGAYVVFELVLLFYLALKVKRKETRLAIMVLLIISLISAFMPSASRLRYYMYWMIVVVSMNLYLVCESTKNGWIAEFRKGLGAPAILGLISGTVLSIVIISTHGSLIRPKFYGFSEFSKRHLDKNIYARLVDDNLNCLQIPQRQFNFLYSSVFHPPRKYSIFSVLSNEECGSGLMIKE